MRLGGFVAVTVFVLVILASAFPQVLDSRRGVDNTGDHMEFTRELGEHKAQIEALKEKTDALATIPEKMARMEERQSTQSWMIFGILGGVGSLLLKEVWAGLRALRNRRTVNDYRGDG